MFSCGTCGLQVEVAECTVPDSKGWSCTAQNYVASLCILRSGLKVFHVEFLAGYVVTTGSKYMYNFDVTAKCCSKLLSCSDINVPCSDLEVSCNS